MYDLDTGARTPLYQQIVDQTQEALARGYLQEGDQLPSVREMARTLVVNESTVTRAYREMEGLGMIETVVGRGTFISLDRDKMEGAKERLLADLRDLLGQAIFLGIGLDEVIRTYRDLEEGKENEDGDTTSPGAD